MTDYHKKRGSMIQINISNKVFFTFLSVVILLTFGILVYAYADPIPDPGHGADTILISIYGQEKTLQQAISDGDITNAPTSILRTQDDHKGKFGDDDGYEKLYTWINTPSDGCATGYHACTNLEILKYIEKTGSNSQVPEGRVVGQSAVSGDTIPDCEGWTSTGRTTQYWDGEKFNRESCNIDRYFLCCK